VSAASGPMGNERLRERLRRIGDRLIPAEDDMPSASEVGVADRQLDRVLAARPDLAAPLARALERIDLEAEVDRALSELADADAEAHEALLLTVAGGYYIDPDVRTRIGYDGQEPVEVRPEIIPPYVEEELVQYMLDRGPIWRPITSDGKQEAS
jgi:hypothetical protein